MPATRLCPNFHQRRSRDRVPSSATFDIVTSLCSYQLLSQSKVNANAISHYQDDWLGPYDPKLPTFITQCPKKRYFSCPKPPLVDGTNKCIKGSEIGVGVKQSFSVSCQVLPTRRQSTLSMPTSRLSRPFMLGHSDHVVR